MLEPQPTRSEAAARPELTREMLEMVFDHVENGIYLVDGQGVTLAVNRTYEEMSGFTNVQLVGRRLDEMVGPDNLFSGSASLLVLQRKGPVTATYSTSTGRKLLVKGRPIFGDWGEIRYVINTIWDLTVVQYSQKIDADTARSQMLSEEDIITCSEKMMSVVDLALRVAQTDSTLLLSGESGVGKSLLAKLVHRSSERRAKPLMQINCGAIPESLIESELFGYEPGAFTGADRRGKPGLFEMAQGGTVFLDEISELPLHLQSKLLGVIQDRSFMKIGGREPMTVDVRIIAATNRELMDLVRQGRFREDLFYRLNVVPIKLPPLRERRDDIPLLVRYFADKFNRRHRCYKQLSDELVQRLQSLPWQGNIRELENLVERLIVTTAEEIITPADAQLEPQEPELDPDATLGEMMARQERTIILSAWKKHRTTRRIAAALGISQASAARKLKRALESDIGAENQS